MSSTSPTSPRSPITSTTTPSGSGGSTSTSSSSDPPPTPITVVSLKDVPLYDDTKVNLGRTAQDLEKLINSLKKHVKDGKFSELFGTDGVWKLFDGGYTDESLELRKKELFSYFTKTHQRNTG